MTARHRHRSRPSPKPFTVEQWLTGTCQGMCCTTPLEPVKKTINPYNFELYGDTTPTLLCEPCERAMYAEI